MRALVVLALACFIAACATPPPPTTALESKPQRTRLSGFATLCDEGSYSCRAAPVYTRLAQLRHNAARALEAGKIGVDQARAIQSRADVVRALLDNGIAADKRGDAANATINLIEALSQIEKAERRLKEQT